MEHDLQQIVPVSVIVPLFNSGHTLRDCITSLNAGIPPAEIVIIDDGSTDGSAGVAHRLAEEFSNVQVIVRPLNGGIVAARLDGLRRASQDWITLVDADDTLEHDALSSAFQQAVGQNADICIWQLWRSTAEKTWCAISLANITFPLSGREAAELTLGQWRIHPLGVSRRELYLSSYETFRETTANAEELITRLAFLGARKIVSCEKRYFYTVSPASMANAMRPRRLTFLRSNLWLLRFCDVNDFPKHAEVVNSSLSDAWNLWCNRKIIGRRETKRTLRRFLPRLFVGAKMWRPGRASPKLQQSILLLWLCAMAPLV